jgi:hypothetical protein
MSTSDESIDTLTSEHKFLVGIKKGEFESEEQAILAAQLPSGSVACGEAVAIDGARLLAFKVPPGATETEGLEILILSAPRNDEPDVIDLWKSSTDFARPTLEEANDLLNEAQERNENSHIRVFVQFMEISEAISAWAVRLGIASQDVIVYPYRPSELALHDHWSVCFRFSTVPMENWRYHKSKLKPEDILIYLNVPGDGLWYVTLHRQDELFYVQWEPDEDLYIESEQIKYKRLTQWPRLESLDGFPEFVKKLESTLSIKFLRHVNVSVNESDEATLNIDNLLKYCTPQIREWLSPCADTLGKEYHSKDWVDPEPEAIGAQLASALASVDYAAEYYPSLVIDQEKIDSLAKRSGKTLAELRASEDYANQRDVILRMKKNEKQSPFIRIALTNAHGGYARGIISDE